MKAATLEKDLELQLWLKETLTFSIISPRSISRATEDDIKIFGIHIRKRARVQYELYAKKFNKHIFRELRQFKIERFTKVDKKV